MRSWYVNDAFAMRLDLFLVERLGVTRGEARRAIEDGKVSVGGRVTDRVATIVETGSEVVVEGPVVAEDLRIEPEYDLVLRIIDEGNGWVAIDKPAGRAVHPLRTGETGTLLNAVAARWPHVQGIGEGGLRSGVVHRLDVTTSGVILVATAQPAWERLREAFEQRTIRKRYHALVEGHCAGSGAWEMDLRVAAHKPARVEALPISDQPHPESRRCDLRWQALSAGDGATLISVDLGTGFLHQIRAMAAAQGHPVVGDEAYGSVIETTRPMLHADTLEFDGHVLRAPPPDDFVAAGKTLNISVSR
ncbi:pseudouridine synthase [Mucisphaera calidilacus]|uniref:Ribosomal large subunit pseudouridine synthase D n=1 Tax=Mucisphaera calidilacus TaxID=2527982 RepID=A0A518BZA6_9BACT|nr:pseudouridine synthase [Mucisphaera calidilacus]QDU72307.1 Ribosomal large subunit pseudouridine synthase D [Mucisphaera calidilacus]